MRDQEDGATASQTDGRIAPPWKGQVRRKAERQEFSRRIVMLSEEVDKGIRTWEQKQQEKATEQEEKRKNLLNAKGDILRSKKAQ